jgi:hypothetical protein
MKYLVPLARANEADCVRLAEAVQEAKLSTRQLGQLYQTYLSGNDKTRELVITEPLLVLRVEQQVQRDTTEISNAEALISELHAIGGLARRAYGRLRRGVSLLAPERERASRALGQAQADFQDLQSRWEKQDARSRHEGGGPHAQEQGRERAANRAGASDLAGSGEEGALLGDT